jgi:secondary thiamine-phosphate synthase enzyme
MSHEQEFAAGPPATVNNETGGSPVKNNFFSELNCNRRQHNCKDSFKAVSCTAYPCKSAKGKAMDIMTDQFTISSRGNSEVLNITENVEASLAKSKLREGAVTVFVVGSTASITTTEFEPGLRKDIPEMLTRIAPQGERYHHDDTWHDGNGHSHLRAALMGCAITIPFLNGEMMLGTWQQIALVDHDNRPRQRTIVVQLIGKQ